MLSSKLAENSQETWAIYDANYRQKAEATRNKDWLAIDTTYFSQCFTGKARKVEGCSDCGSLKHETTECPRKKGKHLANKDIKAPSPKQQKTKPANWNYKCPCHLIPAHTSMNASSAPQRTTNSSIAPNNSKRKGPRNKLGIAIIIELCTQLNTLTPMLTAINLYHKITVH